MRVGRDRCAARVRLRPAPWWHTRVPCGTHRAARPPTATALRDTRGRYEHTVQRYRHTPARHTRAHHAGRRRAATMLLGAAAGSCAALKAQPHRSGAQLHRRALPNQGHRDTAGDVAPRQQRRRQQRSAPCPHRNVAHAAQTVGARRPRSSTAGGTAPAALRRHPWQAAAARLAPCRRRVNQPNCRASLTLDHPHRAVQRGYTQRHSHRIATIDAHRPAGGAPTPHDTRHTPAHRLRTRRDTPRAMMQSAVSQVAAVGSVGASATTASDVGVGTKRRRDDGEFSRRADVARPAPQQAAERELAASAHA